MATRPDKLPRFATGGSASVVEPSEGKKDAGWEADEMPPAGYFNWLHKLTFQALEWLVERMDSLVARTKEGASSTRLGVHGLDSDGSVDIGEDAQGDGNLNVSAPLAGRPAAMFWGKGGVEAVDCRAGGSTASDIGARGLGGVGVFGVTPSSGPGSPLGSGGVTGVHGVGPIGVHGESDGESGLGAGVRAEGKGNRMGVWATTYGSGAAVHAECDPGSTAPPIQIVARASAPTSVSNGALYYDSTTHKLRVYANGAWVDLN